MYDPWVTREFMVEELLEQRVDADASLLGKQIDPVTIGLRQPDRERELRVLGLLGLRQLRHHLGGGCLRPHRLQGELRRPRRRLLGGVVVLLAGRRLRHASTV